MNIQRLIGLYCLAFLLAGCSNWLDVQPYDQISEDELVKSEEGLFTISIFYENYINER